MTEPGRKATEWGLAVAYMLFLVLGDSSGWLTGKPKASVQDVIELGTFFVLLAIGGLLWGIYDWRMSQSDVLRTLLDRA